MKLLKAAIAKAKTLIPHQAEPPPAPLPESTAEFEPETTKQDEAHPCEAYNYLKIRFRDIGRMNAIIEALGRDFLTALPQGAYQSRLGQIVFLHRRMHEDLTDDRVQEWLDAARAHQHENPGKWDEWDAANLREMTQMYLMNAHIDADLIERKAHLSYEGRNHHRALKASGDWQQAKKFLAEQIDLHRKIADARCEALGLESHYEALMLEFMPGITVKEVETLFSAHETALNDLYPQIVEYQKAEGEPKPIDAHYEPEAQMWLNRSILNVLGFDFDRGSLHETGHNPVEGGTVDDTRLVIGKAEDINFLHSLKSALHEGGHGLYIQGLPRQTWRYQPVAMDLGAAVHESQALLIEMIIGRMTEFFEYLSPRLEGVFQAMNNPALTAENLRMRKTRIKAGVDRKKADEVTYFYHINLRFKLERDLIEGTLKIDDLPDAWEAGIRSSLGVMPDNYLEGCLQDVHWFVGKFGYFPAYALGHMMAAQLLHKIQKDIPDLRTQIGQGDFNALRAWLNDNIYAKGRLMDMQDMLTTATGKPLRAEYLAKHLKRRYLG